MSRMITYVAAFRETPREYRDDPPIERVTFESLWTHPDEVRCECKRVFRRHPIEITNARTGEVIWKDGKRIGGLECQPS